MVGTGTSFYRYGTEVLYEYVGSGLVGTWVRYILTTGTDILVAAPIRMKKFDFKLTDFSAIKTFLPILGMAAQGPTSLAARYGTPSPKGSSHYLYSHIFIIYGTVPIFDDAIF